MLPRRSSRVRCVPDRYEPEETEFVDDEDLTFTGEDDDEDDDDFVNETVESEDDESSVGSFIVNDDVVEYMTSEDDDEDQSDDMDCGEWETDPVDDPNDGD